MTNQLLGKGCENTAECFPKIDFSFHICILYTVTYLHSSDFDFSILGNGWALMGAADALSALELFPDLKKSEEYQILLENFQNHAGNLSLWQSQEDGRWHNMIKGMKFLFQLLLESIRAVGTS